MNNLTKTEQAWLDNAKNFSYNALTAESKVYYDFLMQKSRIPAAVEKSTAPKTKTIRAPTEQPQKVAPKGEAKMAVFMLGCIIIGFALRFLYLDFNKPIQKSASEKVVHKTKSHGK